MSEQSTLAQMEAHFYLVKEIIEKEDMWERVPEHARQFSPENLENLVKYAYFAGFLDMSQVLRLLFLKKRDRAHCCKNGTRRSGRRAAGFVNPQFCQALTGTGLCQPWPFPRIFSPLSPRGGKGRPQRIAVSRSCRYFPFPICPSRLRSLQEIPQRGGMAGYHSFGGFSGLLTRLLQSGKK